MDSIVVIPLGKDSHIIEVRVKFVSDGVGFVLGYSRPLMLCGASEARSERIVTFDDIMPGDTLSDISNGSGNCTVMGSKIRIGIQEQSFSPSSGRSRDMGIRIFSRTSGIFTGTDGLRSRHGTVAPRDLGLPLIPDRPIRDACVVVRPTPETPPTDAATIGWRKPTPTAAPQYGGGLGAFCIAILVLIVIIAMTQRRHRDGR
jgi:hypothetical protein